jgi:cytoskeletal protein CcmA (bactofilin family)
VVIHGKVDGNVYGTDRVELKRSAVLTGDISTQRIVIEDGAYFKGAIDIKKESKPAASVVKETPKAFAAVAAAEPGFSPQASFAEEKKY